MDRFEGLSTEMKSLKKEYRRVFMDSKKKMCACPDCPSYNECARNSGETLFCMFGMSFHCISADKGCTCRDCPLYREFGLTGNYFCMKGSEKAMRYDTGLE
jgi:Protein of unknown function (DUF2769).